MGPSQVASHMVQKHVAGEQETNWDKTNKEITILDDLSSLFVLSQCVSCSRSILFVVSFYSPFKWPPLFFNTMLYNYEFYLDHIF